MYVCMHAHPLLLNILSSLTLIQYSLLRLSRVASIESQLAPSLRAAQTVCAHASFPDLNSHITCPGRCYFWNTVGFGSIVAQYTLVSSNILPIAAPNTLLQSSSVRCLVVEVSGKLFVSGHSDGLMLGM